MPELWISVFKNGREDVKVPLGYPQSHTGVSGFACVCGGGPCITGSLVKWPEISEVKARSQEFHLHPGLPHG